MTNFRKVIMEEINWLEEAEAVINDIKPFVKMVHLSKHQPDTDCMVLMNLETFENETFCIKLCGTGFGIAGYNYDTENIIDINKWYETPYAMLTEISRSYVERFKESLVEKLKKFENGNE